MKKYTLYIYIVLLNAVLLMTGCSPYDEICEENHPHLGNLRFGWHWGADEERPDEMMVFAFRNTNLIKYQFAVDVNNAPHETKDGFDFYAKAKQEYPTEHCATATDRITIHEGEYDMMCCNVKDDYYIINFDEILANNFDSLRVEFLPIGSLKEHPLYEHFYDWMDRNPYTSYLMPIDYVGFGYQKNVNVPKNQVTDVKFDKSSDIAQVVTFDFSINKLQKGMRIEEMRAEVSGTPAVVWPMADEVDKSKTYKSLFYPQVNDSYDNEGALHIQHSIPMLGIVAPYSDKVITGPGILQVELLCSYINDKGVKRTSRIRAGYNLFHRLHTAPSLIEKEGHTYMNGHTLRIELRTPLELDINGLKNVSPGFDDWEEIETIHYDI